MEIYLIRHGIAAERDGFDNTTDPARPLTTIGRNKIKFIAQAMRTMGLSFDVIISSPYKRARQTAIIIATSFKTQSKEIVLTDNLIPDAKAMAILTEINRTCAKYRSVLLVGHEPHLSTLISLLLTGTTHASISLKKGGLCHLSSNFPLTPKNSTLNCLLTPAQMQRLQ